MTHPKTGLFLPLLFALMLAAPIPWPGASTALAADHFNLEDGLPVEVTDTLPIPYRSLEFQPFVRWDHTEQGEERFRAVPRFEYGLFRNAQIQLDAPFVFGEAVEDDEFKTVGLELMYNFNQEGLLFPAVALAGKADFPVGDEEDGVDTTLKLILSKTVGRSAQWHRVHLNASWKRNNESEEEERDDRYVLILGYDCRVRPDTILVLDYVRQEEKRKNEDTNLLEAGLRYQLTPLTVIAAGVGAGFGEDSPDFRTTLAFQHSFNAWFLD